MARLNIEQILIAYGGATIASVSSGLVGSYILTKLGYQADYGLVTATTWFTFTGLPSCFVATSILRQKLGERQTTTVTGNTLSRKIPINGGLSHVFMSVLPIRDNGNSDDYGLADNFTVGLNGNSHTVKTTDLEDFLRVVWRRQLSGLNGLSRKYWTTQRRPRLKTLEYNARMAVISSVNGLIIDRSERRSGKLALPPLAALNALNASF